MLEELEFRQTDERMRILEELSQLQERAVQLANSTDDQTTRHRVLNVAQSISGNRDLLVQQWHLADGQRNAA